MSVEITTVADGQLEWRDDGTVAVLSETYEEVSQRWLGRRRGYGIVAVACLALLALRPRLLMVIPRSADLLASASPLVWIVAGVGTLCGLSWFLLARGAGRRRGYFLRIDRREGTISGSFGRRIDAEGMLWNATCLGLIGIASAGLVIWAVTGLLDWDVLLGPLGFLVLAALAYLEWRRTRNPRSRFLTTPEGVHWMETPWNAFTHLVWVKDIDQEGELHIHFLGIETGGSLQKILLGGHAILLYPHRHEVSDLLGRCTGLPIWESIDGSHSGTTIGEWQEQRQSQSFLSGWCRPLED